MNKLKNVIIALGVVWFLILVLASIMIYYNLPGIEALCAYGLGTVMCIEAVLGLIYLCKS